MTHRDRLDLLLAYLAGSLDEPDAGRVRALLAAGDPATVGAAAEAREVLARIAATAEPVTPTATAKTKLMAGLAARRPATPAATTVGSVSPGIASSPAPARGASAPLVASTPRPASRAAARPAPSPWRNLRIAAAALVVFGVAGYMVGQLRDRDAYRRRAESAELAASAKDQQIAQLAQRATEGDGQAKAVFAALYSPDARFGVMNAAGGDVPADKKFGRVVVDPAARQVQVFIFDLKPVPTGRDYQLWLIPEGGGAPVPQGVFKVDASGKGSVTAALPAGMTVAAAAVSEEPAGGSKTGKPDVVKLVGKPG